MSDGMMEDGPNVNGRKLLITVIGGLFILTLVGMFLTLTVGRYFGHVLNQKALQHERDIDAQRLRDKEASRN